MAGVHGLEHVDRLRAAHLPHHDAIGTHSQRVTNQISDADLAGTLGVRWA